MARFVIEKRVPSVKVTKKLLESIERYLVGKKAALQIDFASPPDSERLTIALTDNLGTETISSTDQLRTDRYLDSTTDIKLTFDCKWYKFKTSLEVDVRFSAKRALSSVTVACESDTARELGVGLYQSLSDITATAKTSNWRYHAPPGQEGAIMGVAISLLVWGAVLVADRPIFGMALAVPGGLAFVYLTLGKRLHPYTLFDSSRAERIQKAGDWFGYGLLTFLVFGIAFTLIRRVLLGF